MALTNVKVTAQKLEKRKKRLKYTKRIVIILFILLLAIFFVLMVIYKGGSFTVTLDPNFSLKSGLVLFEHLDNPEPKNRLYAKEIDFMDNISVNWLPQNINNEAEGAHNGENYIAYTFYVGNHGKETISGGVQTPAGPDDQLHLHPQGDFPPGAYLQRQRRGGQAGL